jgi:hypothetical protein
MRHKERKRRRRRRRKKKINRKCNVFLKYSQNINGEKEKVKQKKNK